MDTMGILTATFGTSPFTLREAQAAGVSRDAVKHAVAKQRIQRIRTGVFLAAPSSAETPYVERVRAAALRHPDAILVEDAAAALHNLWCPWPTGWRGIIMAAPKAHRAYSHERLVRRRIDEQDVTTVDGIACATPARTALDIAARATLAEGLVVVDSFGRLTNPTRRQALDASFRTGVRDELLHTTTRMRHVRGIDRARYAAALANPAAESAPESYARGLFIAAGYPEPQVGRPVRGADGKTYYADLSWPDRRLVVEIDGAEKYDVPGVIVAEKRREDALRGTGHDVKRIIAGDLWKTGIATMERRAA